MIRIFAHHDDARNLGDGDNAQGKACAPMPVRRLFAAAAWAGTLATVPCASAAVLEEVIVTAQVREQSLQDVAVSVNAVSGDRMLEAGIAKMDDLQAYVPNLTMTETPIGTSIFIRGIGSGANQGFEQSVGMYVDGIYYGRAQLSRAPFLDLARVEVLRGPQNILYGKNTIAGAVSITTKDPSDEFEALVSATYGPELDEKIADLVLTGPLTNAVGYRFALRGRETGGYMENLTLDRDEPQREEVTARLKLLWDVSDRLQMSFKGEIGRFDVVGRHGEILKDVPSVSGNALFAGRTQAEIYHDTEVPGVLDIESDDSVLNNFQDFKRSSNGDFSNNDTGNITVTVDWRRGAHEFTAITGYMTYEYDELCDCDFTGAEVFKFVKQEEYDQISQEVRWVSPAGEPIEFIGGAYFQRNDLDFFDSIIVDSDILVQLLNAADAAGGCGRGDFDPDPTSTQPEEQAGCGDAGNAIADTTTPRDFTTDSTLWSAFLQTTFNLPHRLRLTLGGRYSYEKKKGTRRMTFGELDFSERPVSETDTVGATSFGIERHDLKGERSEQVLSPLVNIQWETTADLMLYATATRGFKSGGFDARSNASPAGELTPRNPDAAVPNRLVLRGAFEFEEEKATSYELGAKSRLLDGAAELNVALFHTEYNDLQVSIFDGRVGFDVENAATAVNQGVELDGRWQATEWLNLAASVAYLDFEFTDFEDGQCRPGQEPDRPDGVHCDYTGKTNQYAADFSGNVSARVRFPVATRLVLSGTLDAIFTTDYAPISTLDPAVQQPGYVKFNGRVALGRDDRRWELALLGKNLTDKAIVAQAVHVPLSFAAFGTRTYFGFLEPPRNIALQYTHRW